jgi:hypothetical protein
VIVGCLLAALAAASWHLARAASSADAAAPDQVLQRVSVPAGNPVTLLPADVAQIRAMNDQTGQRIGSVALILTRNDLGFYRAENAGRNPCYAVGPAKPGSWLLGQIDCKPDFPSATTPVMDFTVMHGPGIVWQSEGIVADGIVDVALQREDGTLSNVTPVINNVYSITKLPTTPVDALVARDSNGNVLWSEPLK